MYFIKKARFRRGSHTYRGIYWLLLFKEHDTTYLQQLFTNYYDAKRQFLLAQSLPPRRVRPVIIPIWYVNDQHTEFYEIL
jgi:hypothetical protein